MWRSTSITCAPARTGGGGQMAVQRMSAMPRIQHASSLLPPRAAPRSSAAPRCRSEHMWGFAPSLRVPCTAAPIAVVRSVAVDARLVRSRARTSSARPRCRRGRASFWRQRRAWAGAGDPGRWVRTPWRQRDSRGVPAATTAQEHPHDVVTADHRVGQEERHAGGETVRVNGADPRCRPRRAGVRRVARPSRSTMWPRSSKAAASCSATSTLRPRCATSAGYGCCGTLRVGEHGFDAA
ncbi:hypothetical protein BH23ACT9_BH23ACT9_39150 [soil metagenome]